MATKLTKPVVREVRATEPRSLRPYVVTMEPTFIRIKEKGKRGTGYSVTYDQIFTQGARNIASITT